jgi:pimeloyl-ACP methyl ester carboxylesterase
MRPRPFSIDVPQAVLDDLKRRLESTRWAEQIPGVGWEYGADVIYVRELCDYWRTTYDWRKHEAEVNRYPQFLCEVDGIDIQFWHVKGNGPNAFPLLLIHGWPGSMIEFQRLVGPLTDPAAHGADPDNAFDVVVPSLPGFGWSGKPRERGWGVSRIAAAFNTLMLRALGYRRYGVQGGDWGGIIAAKMGSAYADQVSAIHLNFFIGVPPAEMSETDKAFAAKRAAFRDQETGYSSVQGTKPDSLTVGLTDSPAGLAAWVTEKFRTWSDCGGNLESAFSKDTLLTNLMFYWAPNSVASAARIYYEARRNPVDFRYPKVEVPTGAAIFPAEPWQSPRHWVEPHFNMRRWTQMPCGGHFAALEQPGLLLEDVRAFFASSRQ